MAGKTARWRVGAGIAAGAVLLTACTGSDDGSQDSTENSAPESGSLATERDDKLDIGFIYDETGPLGFLGAPQRAGIELAVSDINAAGGVNGQDVTLAIGDEAGLPHIVRELAARFVNENKDAVIGAAASGMSQEFIQLLHDSRTVQCSGTNTSTSFTNQDNNTYYYRTVPPDAAVAPLIAEWMVEEDNHSDIAVVSRNDDYGRALGDLIVEGVTSRDANPTRIEYDPTAEDFTDVVDKIVAADPDGVALIAFGESIPILTGALLEGMSADQFYGGDGTFGTYVSGGVAAALQEAGDTEADVGAVAGMTVIGAAGTPEFNDRLNDALPDGEKGNFIYGGQVYDCAVIIALAATAAGSTDPAVFHEHIAAQTKEGTKCTSYSECVELLANGEDIDYDGVSGPLEITHPDPAVGGYAIATFLDDGTLGTEEQRTVDLAELGG